MRTQFNDQRRLTSGRKYPLLKQKTAKRLPELVRAIVEGKHEYGKGGKKLYGGALNARMTKLRASESRAKLWF